jgi:hypothetical protein
VRYVVVPNSADTTLAAIRTSDGAVVGAASVAGSFGIPMVTQDGLAGGLSLDGRTLVLGDAMFGLPLRTVSHFVVLNAKQLQLAPHAILLPGDYSYDALSPDGKRLYLIQHVSARKLLHYVVRAYDLAGDRLLPGRIADRTQRGWVMNGYPLTRATSDDGRWAYTLYQNPGGTPFVHALDTVRGVAHCIGIPWKGSDQSGLWNVRLSLRDGGRQLAVHWRSGRPFLNVDTRTWRVSAAGRAGFPWLPVAGGIAAAAALALLLRRRRIGAHVEGPFPLPAG